MLTVILQVLSTYKAQNSKSCLHFVQLVSQCALETDQRLLQRVH